MCRKIVKGMVLLYLAIFAVCGCQKKQVTKVAAASPADELREQIQKLNELFGIHREESSIGDRVVRRAFHFYWKPEYVTIENIQLSDAPFIADVRIRCVGKVGFYWGDDPGRITHLPLPDYMPYYRAPQMYGEASGQKIEADTYELKLKYEYVNRVWRLRHFNYKREGADSDIAVVLDEYPRLEKAGADMK